MTSRDRAISQALTEGRCVQALVRGAPGPRRTLFRSIGMGGPPSMLQWNAGYDPVVEPVGGKLFVDDLTAMIVGPRRALRIQ